MVVIVLGHRLQSPSAHPQLSARVETGLEALEESDATTLLCSGGRANETVPYAESQIMREYALERGVDDAAILTEEQSVDTIGNAYYSRRRLEAASIEPETIVLVTDESHIDRAAYVFERCFGSDVRLETDYVCESPTAGFSAGALERTREFFAPVTPGDLEAIERRLLETHDHYLLDDAASRT